MAVGRWIPCFRCREGIYMSPEREQDLRRSGATWYCLWGHGQVFASGPTEAELLRRERDRLKQEGARLTEVANQAQREAESERRRAAAARGQVTKLKRAASGGQCPCCAHRFPNLKRHIEAKHPEFVAEGVEGEPA